MKTTITSALVMIISVFTSVSAVAQVNTPVNPSEYFVQNNSETVKQQAQSRMYVAGDTKKEETSVSKEASSPQAEISNGAGPAGYIKCTFDNSSFNFNEIVDVAYGANGKFSYKTHVAGTIKFDSKTFGDPNPGVEKAGYYRLVPKKQGN